MGLKTTTNAQASATAEEAFLALKALTTDSELRSIANAIEEVGLPPNAITDVFLLKVLLNKHLYLGWESVTDVVAGTKRQGLYQRPFGGEMQARVGAVQRNSAEKPPLDRPGADSTVAFRNAANMIRSDCESTGYKPFMPTLAKGVAAWKALYPKNQGERGLDPVWHVAKALDRMILCAGEAPLSLVPASAYIAMALMLRPDDVAAEAMNLMAGKIQINLQMPRKGTRAVVTAKDLPVSKSFRERFLRGRAVPYGKAYYETHKFAVWTAFMEAFTLSLAGRSADMQLASYELVKDLSEFLPDDLKTKFRSVANGEMHGILRDNDKDTFGYRFAVFGVYDAATARDIALAVAEARMSSMKTHSGGYGMTMALMGADFAIQGSSTVGGIPLWDMPRFATLFGDWKIW